MKFIVWQCSRCGAIEKQQRVEDNEGEFSYEAEKALRGQDLKLAIQEGKVLPKYISPCGSCVDSPAYW